MILLETLSLESNAVSPLAGLLILIGFILLFIIIAGIAIFATVFWILMIVDAAKRKFETDGEKIAWILILVFIGIIGAIVYYFVVKKKDKSK